MTLLAEARHRGVLLSAYANALCIKWYKVISYNKLDSMENGITFSGTLLGLELAEIGGVKVGALIMPSLSNLLHRVQWNQSDSFICV